jgi:hypothetical protein
MQIGLVSRVVGPDDLKPFVTDGRRSASMFGPCIRGWTVAEHGVERGDHLTQQSPPREGCAWAASTTEAAKVVIVAVMPAN